MADTSSSQYAYLKGIDTTQSSIDAYVRGLMTTAGNRHVYLQGATSVTSSIHAYVPGGVSPLDSMSAYLAGIQSLTSTFYAYTAGVIRSTISAYTNGKEIGDTGVTEYDHIWLKTSDLSVQKKFRVLAQNYDDGTLERAENIRKTIGGGIDHSVGAVYRSWNPIVRVRQSEPLTDYGSLADLVYFYNLNDPGATPSNNITLVDHLGESYTVHMVGTFRKSLMGVKVEGEQAWSLVKLQLVEV